MSSRVRTFVDSNILIAAWRGDLVYSPVATALLDDPSREYVSSPYVQLETMPQAIFNKQVDEAQFYNDFFDAVDYWVKASKGLMDEAYTVACDFGLTAVDALHIAAALSVRADEFITAERPTSPLSRVRGVQILSIYSK
jgi:predicted nucleic acid-binding protein